MKSLVLIFGLLLLLIPSTLSAQSENPLFQETVHLGRGAILNAQWHPSGQYILMETATGIWIYRSLQPENSTPIEDIHLGKFSPDGTFLSGVNANNHLLLWDVPTLTLIADLGGRDARVTALEWNPNGSEIATLDYTGTITIWDVPLRKIHVQFQMEHATEIHWSKNGSYLAAMAKISGDIKVWDHNGRKVFSPSKFTCWINSYCDVVIAWKDDTQLIRIIYSEVPSSEVWEVQTGNRLENFPVSYANALSPDGSKIASASIEGFINNLKTKETVKIENVSVGVIEWSPDGNKVGFASVGQVTVVDASSGKTLYRNSFENDIFGLKWCADNNGLLVQGSSRIWAISTNVATGCLSGESTAYSEISTVAAWSSDSQKIIAADSIDPPRIWNTVTGQPEYTFKDLKQSTSQVDWQPGGSLVAIGNRVDNNVYILDTALIDTPYSNMVMVVPHSSAVIDIAWSPDGNTLATSERTRYLHTWSPATPIIIRTMDLDEILNRSMDNYPRTVESIGWNAKSDMVTSLLSNNKGIYINPDTGVITYGAGKNSILTSDNRLISAFWNLGGYRWPGPPPTDYSIRLSVSYIDNRPTVRIPNDLQIPNPLLPNNQMVSGVVFSPNAAFLFAAYQNNTSIIWDVQTQKRVVEIPGMTQQAVWSPDSMMLAVWGSDGLLRIIEPITGKILQVLDRHWGVLPVMWSPDSQKLAVFDHGTIFVYG